MLLGLECHLFAMGKVWKIAASNSRAMRNFRDGFPATPLLTESIPTIMDVAKS